MIAETMQGTSRLLEALEKLGEWAGSAAGGGPSGAPSQDAVRAFEEALDSVSVPADAADQGASASAFSEVQAEAALPGPAEYMPPVDSAAQSAAPEGSYKAVTADFFSDTGSAGAASDTTAAQPSAAGPAEGSSAMQDDPARELLQRLEACAQSGSSITPQELFRIQYLMGVLKVQVQAGLKTSQQSTQGLENMLRQSG